MMFLPPMAQLLQELAPNSRLSNVSVDAARVSAALESQDMDLAIGILLPEQSGIASEHLLHEHFVAITRPKRRPVGGRPSKTLTLQQRGGTALAIAAPTATSHGSVETMLSRLKLKAHAVGLRRVVSRQADDCLRAAQTRTTGPRAPQVRERSTD